MSVSVRNFPKNIKKDYDSVRSDLKSGDILLCKGNVLFSNLIQKATKSIWSHVAFVIRLDSIDRVMVMESVESIGVRTVPLRHYVEDYKGEGKGYNGRLLIARHSDFDDKINKIKLKNMSKFAVDRFGYPYDNDEIAKITARILGFFRRKSKNDNEFICSEYAYECYKSIGINFKYDKRKFIAPADFAKESKVNAIAELIVKK